MNFTVFSTDTTNIFPIANDTKNGQLLTEYNLRCRESINTDPNVNYMIGPSYCHGELDFNIQLQTDSLGTPVSSSVLEISAGRAIVNGHYIESLVPISIDMLKANYDASINKTDPLVGRLCVGLKAMYSTVGTLAGSLLSYDNSSNYLGIQVVILPKDLFKLPSDVPNAQEEITAHLKLGEFNFLNGTITSIFNSLPNRLQVMSAQRIQNVDDLLSDQYITKSGLNPKKLYTFAGKGVDPATGKDTWCDSTDSLMIWDADPKFTDKLSTLKEASFGVTSSGVTQLLVPHKQVDGMQDSTGTAQYYSDKRYSLPLADFSKGTSGTVDKKYTNSIKDIANQLNNIYNLPNGKQVGYIPVLNNLSELPTINPNWSVGDYIIVNQDRTTGVLIDSSRAPVTMYVVLAGIVSKFAYHSMVKNSNAVPSDLKGMQLAKSIYDDPEVIINTDDPEVYGTYFDLSANYRGVPNQDYFMITVITDESNYTNYYYNVSESGDRTYSDPCYLTGQIPLAEETVIGGFYNVPETALDGGYVIRDETGHLRLLDYTLLRSGTLAYQLGEDFTIPSGLTHSEIQTNLDEYVNDRIAFITYSEDNESTDKGYIDLTINLEPEEEESTINISKIDSRFNTYVYLHILGTADNKLTINISDCEKIRIDNNIGGSPNINLIRSNLYYDADVINRLTIVDNLSLWYEQFESTDSNLIVNGMTVTSASSPIIPEEIDYWNVAVSNDIHIMYALRSITFAPDGTIVGCELYVKNDTSANISEGTFIISSMFTLPQGAGLIYPQTRLVHPLKVTGSFVSAYPVDTGYMVIDTNFSALTSVYDEYNSSNDIKGTIAFKIDAQVITAVAGLDPTVSLDCWDTNSYQFFAGGIIG